MPLDPRELGANCDKCPLEPSCEGTFRPRPRPPRAKLAIVVEPPGDEELKQEEPLLGGAKYEVDKALGRFGFDTNTDCHVTPALLCKPPKHFKPKLWTEAMKACRPRLAQEVSGLPILSLGKRAFQGVTGRIEITTWRGSPMETSLGTLLPTIAPGYSATKQLNVFKKPVYRPIFHIDIHRAVSLAKGTLTPWEWPVFAYERHEIVPLLRRYASQGGSVAVDVETDSLDPMKANLTHIGIADTTSGLSWLWDPGDEEVITLVQEVFSFCHLVMQNGNYDLAVLRNHGFELSCAFDTMLAHLVVAPQLPHKLEFIASAEFPLEKWKTNYKAGLADTQVYNVKDTYTTALLEAPLRHRLAETHNGTRLFGLHMDLAEVQLAMRKRGIKVDRDAIEAHRILLTANIKEHLEKYHNLVASIPGAEGLKLGKNGQHPDLKKLYFDVFGLEPKSYSQETGKAELTGQHIKEFRARGGLVGEVSEAIIEIRNNSKLLSTYVNGIPVSDAGFVHPYWGCGPVTGRWKCAGPNAMNIPKKMRDIFVAREDCYIVKADVSGFEAALIALYAGDDGILAEYERGEDLHRNRMQDIFGFVPEDPQQFKDLRDLTKTGVYLMQYGGQPQGMFYRLKPMFPNITLRQVRRMHRAFFTAHPKYKDFHNEILDIAEVKDYVEEPIDGRREYFYRKVSASKVYNFPAQGGAAAIMNRAVREIYFSGALDWPKEGILFQVHDELNLEGPDPIRLGNILRKSMSREVSFRNRTLKLRIDLKIGRCWGKMEEYSP